MKYRYIIIILAVILALIIAGAVYQMNTLDGDIDKSPTEDTEDVADGILNIEETIEVVPIVDTDSGVEAPSLDRNIDISKLSKQSKDFLQFVINMAKENIYNTDAWIDIGIYWKNAGAYSDAEEVWLYVLAIEPGNAIVAANLADLYAYDLRDYTKAEEYYNKAQQIAPKYLPTYFKAVEFFQHVLKDTKKARDFVNLGIKELPQDLELQSLKSSIK